MNIPKDVIDYCSQGQVGMGDKEYATEIIHVDNLGLYETTCGKIPQKSNSFSPEVISYLKKWAEPLVVAETWNESHSGREIINLCVQWKTDDTRVSRRFSRMVDKNGGSLRAEEEFIDRWDFYESE